MLLWIDWQSVAQDEKELKMRGVRSLIKFATLADYLLVPLQATEVTGDARTFTEDIPNYGGRGWCRAEYYIFQCWAEMSGNEGQVQMYVILSDGKLHQYPMMKMLSPAFMPSKGALSNPADIEAVHALEKKMNLAHGRAIILHGCQRRPGGKLDLNSKGMKPHHMGVLGAAINHWKMTELRLTNCGDLADDHGTGRAAGPIEFAAFLRTNTTLQRLILSNTGLREEGVRAIAEALKVNSTLKFIEGTGSPASDAMIEMIKVNKGLETIQQFYPRRGAADVALALAEALKQNTTLTDLRAEYTEWSDELKETIRAAASPSLKKLVL